MIAVTDYAIDRARFGFPAGANICLHTYIQTYAQHTSICLYLWVFIYLNNLLRKRRSLMLTKRSHNLPWVITQLREKYLGSV